MATMTIPKIKINRQWNSASVRQVCIDHDLYTRGDNEAYARMLLSVGASMPSYENLYLIAKDICVHSVDQTVTNIMYLLEKYAVSKTFEINKE